MVNFLILDILVYEPLEEVFVFLHEVLLHFLRIQKIQAFLDKDIPELVDLPPEIIDFQQKVTRKETFRDFQLPPKLLRHLIKAILHAFDSLFCLHIDQSMGQQVEVHTQRTQMVLVELFEELRVQTVGVLT